MSRNIIFVTHHLGGLGGVQRVVDQLAKRFVQDGNDVTVIGCGIQEDIQYTPTSYDYEEILLYQDDIFFKKPWLFFYEKIFNKKLESELDKRLREKPDSAVILANPIVYMLMEKIIKKYQDTAIFIGQMHSSASFVLESKGLYLIYPYIIKNKYLNLDKILFLTDEDSQIIQEYYSINPIKMGAISNPLPNYLENNVESKKMEHSIISFVGRLDPVKQIDHIIKAFSKISANFPSVQLQIYGEGSERRSLESLISELDQEAQIKLMGSTSKIGEVYQKSLFTVMTSKSEGWPSAIVESQLNYTPVVSYNCSPGVEILQKATKEMMIESNIDKLSEKMRYYLENPSVLISISKKGHDYLVDNFSENKIMSQWYQLFEELKKQGD